MQLNVAILCGEIILTFCAVLFAFKFFGKSGLVAWIAIASISANIVTAKTVDLFGAGTACGTVLFASNYLATDVLSERFGKKQARKGVLIGVFSTLVFMIAAQIALLYIPSEYDYANESMQTLFGFNFRISLASIVMYAMSNIADVYLFDLIKYKTGEKYLWLRNNVATILTNCLENFAFIFLAFIGIYSAAECLQIAAVTSVVEIFVAICDTPFLYAARKIKPLGD